MNEADAIRPTIVVVDATGNCRELQRTTENEVWYVRALRKKQIRFFSSSCKNISGIIPTFHDSVRTANWQYSTCTTVVVLTPYSLSRLRERRSWAACFCEEPRRSDATKRPLYSKTTLHTSGTWYPNINFKDRLSGCWCYFSSDVRRGRKSLLLW